MMRCPDGLETKMGCQLFFDILEPFVKTQEFSGVNSDTTAQDLELSIRTRLLEIEWLVCPNIAHNLHLFICHAHRYAKGLCINSEAEYNPSIYMLR